MNSGLLALLFVAAVLLILLALIAQLGKPRLNKQHFVTKWASIETEPNVVAALVGADSLVDEALRLSGVKGETMGERLKHATGHLRDLNGTWSAHKLRNRIVHETGATVSKSDTQTALRQFKNALKDLGAL